MAPRPPRVGRWTSPSTTTRPMDAIDRAISEANFTRLTRRTVPGSPASKSGTVTGAPYVSGRSGGGDDLLLAAQQAIGRPPDLLEPDEELIARPLGVRRQTLHRLHGPLLQHDRDEHLVVEDVEVVDPGPGDGEGVAGEVLDPRARHLEAPHLALDGAHGGR